MSLENFIDIIDGLDPTPHILKTKKRKKCAYEKIVSQELKKVCAKRAKGQHYELSIVHEKAKEVSKKAKRKEDKEKQMEADRKFRIMNKAVLASIDNIEVYDIDL